MKLRTRLAAAVGLVAFLVLAGTGVASALWTASTGTSGTVAVVDLASNCLGTTKLVNGGFEDPNINNIAPAQTRAYAQLASIPSWTVTDDNVIEVWRSQLQNTGAGPAPEGAQVVELNGNNPGTIYQVVATTPGQTLHWSLKHRGRFGVDRMKVSINANNAALVKQAEFSTDNTAWSAHEGTYLVPAGQTSTRISLSAVSSTKEEGQDNAASVGNLIDDVVLSSGPCLKATITRTPAGVITPGNPAPTVTFTTNITNAGATPAEKSAFSVVLPTGLNYVENSVRINGTACTTTCGYNQITRTVTARLGTGAGATDGGSIASGASIPVVVQATVPTTAVGNDLSYTAVVAYRDALAPQWPISVSASETVVVAGGFNLATTSLTTPTLGFGNNQSGTWTFRVTNSGSTAAPAGATVTVTAPGLTGGSASVTGGGSCTGFTGNVSTCAIASLAAGASRDITVTRVIDGAPTGTYTVTATANATGDIDLSNNTATGSAPTPGAPTNLVFSGTTTTQTTLTWTAPANSPGIVGYNIYRNGSTTTSGTTSGANTWTDPTTLTEGTAYWYTVRARDAAGNTSAPVDAGVVTRFAANVQYRINYPLGTQCLGAATQGNPPAADSANNAALRIVTCGIPANNNNYQRWTFTSTGTSGSDAIYRVYPVEASGRAIDLPELGAPQTGPSTADGSGIRVSSTNVAATRTQWVAYAVREDGDTAPYIAFRNVYSGKCLDLPGRTTAVGSQVTQYACNSTPAQKFRSTKP